MPKLKPFNDHAKPPADIAVKLRKHPYRWVKIAIGDQSRMASRATHWRQRPPAAFRDGNLYEFRTQVVKRGDGGGLYRAVYILGRFIPAALDDSPANH